MSRDDQKPETSKGGYGPAEKEIDRPDPRQEQPRQHGGHGRGGEGKRLP